MNLSFISLYNTSSLLSLSTYHQIKEGAYSIYYLFLSPPLYF